MADIPEKMGIKDLLNVNKSDGFSNIFNLHKYIDNIVEAGFYEAGKSYPSITIFNCPNVKAFKFLLGKASLIFERTEASTNRKTNVLLFEWGINELKKDFGLILKLKIIIAEVNMFLGINNPLNFGIENIILTGDEAGRGKIVVFLTPKQRDIIKIFKKELSAKNEGVLGLICCVYAINNTFKDFDKKREMFEVMFEDDISYFNMPGVQSYIADDGLILTIKNAIADHKNDCKEYLDKARSHLKNRLQKHNAGEVLLDSRDIIYIEKLINKIENALNNDI
jgi:hypothetical protein